MTALLDDGHVAGSGVQLPAAPLRVRALGELQLLTPSGVEAVGPGGRGLTGRPRAALAALLVRSGRVVSVDWLTEAIWETRRPRHAGAALQTVLSRLRSHLRAAGLGTALLTRQPGYVLQIDPGAFDVTRFRALAADGRSALRGDPLRAIAALREALALWAGPAYAEFTDAEFAAAEVTNLVDLRHGVLEDLAEGALAVDRPQDAVPLLDAVIAEAPTRERPRGQLMLALYRSGRQADALAVFRSYRTLLGEQLGLQPSAALHMLETRILRQDHALIPAGARPRDVVAVREPRALTTGPPPGNIPLSRTSLVAADGVRTQVRTALATASIVTLTGPGGVGKTRIATTAARESSGPAAFPDGAWLVELAELPDGGSVVHALAATLPEAPGDAEALVDWLRGKRLLLILDSCEHVVGEVAPLVRSIVAACPDVTVLATSRVPLGIESETIVPVAPLAVAGRSPSDAARLFIDRATALVPAFTADGPALAAVEELCARVDGIPLAIELAAGWMRFMTPAEITHHLPDRFRRMRNPHRLAPRRHQTLDAAVEWSYRLLEPADQLLFEQLSVFSGDFDIHEAAAVCGIDVLTAVERVSRLVDQSTVLAGVEPGTGTTRYRMLDTLRWFGRDRLPARPEWARVRRAHALDVVDLLSRGQSALAAGTRGAWVTTVAKRLDDLRSAVRWAAEHDPALALRLVAAAADWVDLRAHTEIGAWALDAVDRWESDGAPADRGLAAVALGVAARCARHRGDREAVSGLVERGAALAGDADRAQALLATAAGECALVSGDAVAAQRFGAEAERSAAAAGDPVRARQGRVLVVLATAADDPAAAEDAARRNLAGARTSLDLAWAQYVLGAVLVGSRPRAAADLLAAARAGGAANGDRVLEGAALSDLARAWAEAGATDRAAAALGEAVRLWRHAGEPFHQWTAVRHAAALLATSGRWRPSRVLREALHPRFPDPAGEVLGAAEDIPADELRSIAAMDDDAVVDTALSALTALAEARPAAGPHPQ